MENDNLNHIGVWNYDVENHLTTLKAFRIGEVDRAKADKVKVFAEDGRDYFEVGIKQMRNAQCLVGKVILKFPDNSIRFMDEDDFLEAYDFISFQANSDNPDTATGDDFPECAPPEPTGVYLMVLTKNRIGNQSLEISYLFSINCTDGEATRLAEQLQAEASKHLSPNYYGIVVVAQLLQHYDGIFLFEHRLKEIEEETLRKTVRESWAATFWKSQR